MNKPKILVIGDSMLDVAHYGSVRRLSPEAPVPILDVERTEYYAGGAANVALNLQAMGAETALVCPWPEPKVEDILRKAGVDIHFTPVFGETVKTRGFAGTTQIYRMDVNHTLSEEESREVRMCAQGLIGWPDAVVLSDYGRGALNDALRITGAFRDVPIYVDPKRVNWTRYGTVSMIKANSQELDEELKYWGVHDSKLLSRLDCSTYIIETRGIDGTARLTGSGREGFENPRPITHGDPTGAGDTFLSQFVYSRCAGLDLDKSIYRAQVAASLAVERIGTAVISEDELERALKELS